MKIRMAVLLVLVMSVGEAATLVTGAGATFPYPIYSRWFDEFHRRFEEYEVQYRPIGSEGGVQQLKQGKVDFAASDVPLSGFQLGVASGFRQLPMLVGAVVPIYNLPGVSRGVQFTSEALAGVYLGKIKRWSDPILKAANRGVPLPDREIVVVHRADGSGTSYVWTEYLSKTSPEWKRLVGCSTSPGWPVGQGAQGNDGLAALVSKTSYAIGYVEFIYAIQNKLEFGAVRNKAGKFVQPDLESVAESAKGASDKSSADLEISITDAPGPRAYPISSFSWFMIPSRIEDAEKRKLILELLRWMLGPGQKQAAALGYVSLPRDLVAKESLVLDRF